MYSCLVVPSPPSAPPSAQFLYRSSSNKHPFFPGQPCLPTFSHLLIVNTSSSSLVPIGARPSGEWRYSARHRILGHERPGWCYPTGRCAYLPSVTCYRQSIKTSSSSSSSFTVSALNKPSSSSSSSSSQLSLPGCPRPHLLQGCRTP